MALYVNGKKVAGIGLPGKSAYQYAVDGGYAGTEEEFEEMLANAGSTGGNPPGTILWYASTTPPDGYLVCNGSVISRTDYADLFSVIGTTFGAGDGTTTFALPNLQAAFIRGAGSQDGYSATFGEKQEATYIETASDDKRILKEPIRNEDKWSPNTSKTSNKVDGTATAYTYKSYFRPYNIALTPIIKY